MKNFTILIIIILSVFIVGCSTNNSTNADANNSITSNSNAAVQTNAKETIAPIKSTISLSELQKHNTESDCWIAYEGTVYDITDLLPVYLGSETAIAATCGTSGQFEDVFIQKYGTSKINVLESKGMYKGKLE